MTSRQYSSYFDQLDSNTKARYKAKLDIIGPNFDDPYSMPEVEYPDIYNYLANTPSPYTKEDLKGYKESGWIQIPTYWLGRRSLRVQLEFGKFRREGTLRGSQLSQLNHG